MKLVTLNESQQLFVVPSSLGYTFLGFDVERFETVRLYNELGWPEPTAKRGTLNAYTEHKCAHRAARAKYAASGWRAKSGLHPMLIGLEGSRVACTVYGLDEVFTVGRSTGWIPCHLMVKGSQFCDAIHAQTELSNLRVLS